MECCPKSNGGGKTEVKICGKKSRTEFCDISENKPLLNWLKKKGVKRPSRNDICSPTWEKPAGKPESNFLCPSKFSKVRSKEDMQKSEHANLEPDGLQQKPKKSGDNPPVVIDFLNADPTAPAEHR